ncbi:uncharacterized protein BDW43DRAFT_303744 [Aspergillus alliaceus]|uniref:uncharacterized protein n=1 Tax=Petromyces alliaceus TaxID=209559 RepID=UPI0012A59EF0|nr:uncharacterized protein BDW43DRAFT_303744 [Aspergillus alliaceus]KAB8228660.1 hypothetical protein BDW43DRAFT_303744 [Aspergillus alliaceus]
MIPNLTLIPVAQMPQQVGVRVSQDDWTRIIDRSARRKLQNRINQRLYNNGIHNASRLAKPLERSNSTIISNSHTASRNEDKDTGDDFSCTMGPVNIRSVMRDFESLALESYWTNSPNRMAKEWMNHDGAVSIFSMQVPGFSETHIPLSLHIFPLPNLRDNPITVQDDLDDEELCHDLMAFWDTRNAGAMLLVWGPSWEPWIWEMTEAFVKKWGFLLDGCEELLGSTNYWRMKRGERPLSLRDFSLPYRLHPF